MKKYRVLIDLKMGEEFHIEANNKEEAELKAVDMSKFANQPEMLGCQIEAQEEK